jgi:hypothetical protein
MANAWMMRPGSSAVEILPYEWDLAAGSFALGDMNAKVRPSPPS